MITTYQTVANEYVVDNEGNAIGRAQNASKNENLKNGKLFRVPWRRIVLDEGHCIRNTKTVMHRACSALVGERRWILTGTPLINAPADLGALLAFTRICKPYDQLEVWRSEIETKLSKGKQDAMASALLRAVVQSSTLRRTKETKDAEGNAIVQLPKLRLYQFQVQLDSKSKEIYDMAHGAVKEAVKVIMMRKGLTASYSHILTYVLRLRQLACATALCPVDFIEAARNRDDFVAEQIRDAIAQGVANKLSVEEQEKIRRVLYELRESDCPVCLSEIMEEPRITPCRHAMCLNCILEAIRAQKERNVQTTCPMCRQPLNEKSLISLPPNYVPSEVGKDAKGAGDDSYSEGDGTFHAAKAKELIRLLRLTGKTRSLIFSQWTSHLRHLGDCLDDEGITWLQFDGSMSSDKRESTIRTFRSTGGPQCLLLTLKSGGLGLNLTVASNVFIMDPWWQGQIEQQAIDRAYRIGQTKEVNVYQLIAKGTIEESVLEKQTSKQSMINEAFSGIKGAVQNREAVPSGMTDILHALGIAPA